jgi:hypothetical protein
MCGISTTATATRARPAGTLPQPPRHQQRHHAEDEQDDGDAGHGVRRRVYVGEEVAVLRSMMKPMPARTETPLDGPGNHRHNHPSWCTR